MKRIILTTIFVFFCFVKGNTQTTKNKVGNKIYGDFNGDGKYEYAFRVLTKKGYGNPAEEGVSDEYEVHFSDKSIKPIMDNFYWFILINEGDLDNDGSDEISVRQDPMNGCIGLVRTYTIYNSEMFKLINDFSFYSGTCDNEMSISPQDLIEKDNGIVYYYEYDVNGKISTNKFGKKIFAKKVKIFHPKSKPVAAQKAKVSSNMNDNLASIMKGSNAGYRTGDASSNTLEKDSGEQRGYSLGTNRKALSKPAPKYTCNETGKVVVEVTVDRNGRTINAIPGIKGSTNTASCLLEPAKIAAMNTRWDISENAPERQVGKIVYNFNLN